MINNQNTLSEEIVNSLDLFKNENEKKAHHFLNELETKINVQIEKAKNEIDKTIAVIKSQIENKIGEIIIKTKENMNIKTCEIRNLR